MIKIKHILDEIGFRDRMSKNVDDESKAEFQDFGEYVGSLYQRFQTKDLSAEPAIAQKIRDFVSIEDAESELVNKIKDLEHLIDQLPNKEEKRDKIGYRRNEVNEANMPINSPVDLIDSDILDIPDGSVGEIKRAAAKLGIDPQNKYESELRDEIDDLLTSPMSTYEEYELVKKYFGDYADELIQDYGLKIDEAMYGTATHDAPKVKKGEEYSKIEKAWDNLSYDEQKGIIDDVLSGGAGPSEYEKSFDQLSSENEEFESAIANYVGIDEMTNDEFEKAKEADRLEKHPERDKIKKIQQMISKEKQLKESLQRRAGING